MPDKDFKPCPQLKVAQGWRQNKTWSLVQTTAVPGQWCTKWNARPKCACPGRGRRIPPGWNWRQTRPPWHTCQSNGTTRYFFKVDGGAENTWGSSPLQRIRTNAFLLSAAYWSVYILILILDIEILILDRKVLEIFNVEISILQTFDLESWCWYSMVYGEW